MALLGYEVQDVLFLLLCLHLPTCKVGSLPCLPGRLQSSEREREGAPKERSSNRSPSSGIEHMVLLPETGTVGGRREARALLYNINWPPRRSGGSGPIPNSCHYFLLPALAHQAFRQRSPKVGRGPPIQWVSGGPECRRLQLRSPRPPKT